MIVLFTLFFFILGTCVGSFLNSVAYRTVHGGSIFIDNSKCPHCQHGLAPPDLIPIVSFLLLRGKCRYCGKPISVQYPLVELATGALFALTFYNWSLATGNWQLETGSFIYMLFVVSVFVVLFVTDLVDGLLPNVIILPAIIVVTVYKVLLLSLGVFPLSSLGLDLLAAFLASLAFFIPVILSREKAMGGGDVKLVFLLGVALGWEDAFLALLVGFLTGAAVAVMLILLGKKRFGQTVPLGPFLVFGSLVALFWGQKIVDLYLSILLR